MYYVCVYKQCTQYKPHNRQKPKCAVKNFVRSFL